MSGRNIAVAWLPFFIAPLFWVGVLSSYLTIDMLCLACGLAIAAALTQRDTNASAWHWLFFILLTTPFFLHYLNDTLRAPWQEFRLYFYLISAWIIFRMSQSYASDLIKSTAWNTLLAIVGSAYVVFAICGMYGVHPFTGNDFFPIWAPNQSGFGGPLIQRNMESLFMCLITVGLLFQSVKQEQKPLPWLLAALLPCAGIFLSSSRAAPIILAIGITLSVLATHNKRKYLANVSLCITAAIFLSAYLHIPGSETVSERFVSESSGIKPRLFIWSISSMLTYEHPWLGIGWGNFIAYGTDIQASLLSHFPSLKALQMNMEGAHQWTHNFFLEFLLAAGVLGGLISLFITFSLLHKLFFALRDKCNNGESFMAIVGSCMMLAHSMVSVALFQGFFLVLFAIYMAGAFPAHSLGRIQTHLRPVYFIPALLAAGIWFSLVTTQWELQKSLPLPMKSDKYIIAMSSALENPWTHRQALRHYAAKMALEHAPGSTWVRSEPFIYALWNEFQSSVHLKFLIILAHMKSDKLMEKHLISKFTKAFPTNSACDILIHHNDKGHEKGEPINVWQ